MADLVPNLASLSSIMGLDGLIIMFISTVILGAPVIGLVLLMRYFTGKRAVEPPERRLQILDAMRGAGSITEVEYQDQRRRVLSEI